MYDQRGLAGRAVRGRVPRSAHEAWQLPDDRPDPIELLAENNLPRLPDLVQARLRRSGRRGRVRPDHRGQGLVSGASAGARPAPRALGSLAGDRGRHPGPFGMKNGTPAAGYAREFTRRRYARC